MKIAVFAYNFPHRKTQEFLFRLYLEGYDVQLVLAADPVKLNIAKSTVRVKPHFSALVEPSRICERLGWRYEAVDHSSDYCAELIKSAKVDIGVIAGARILKEPVISAPWIGIINFHPGLIPEVRGLDALQWAILQDKPIGVTAHLIDRSIDAGLVILKEEINMLPESLNTIISARDLTNFELVGHGVYNKKMSPEEEAQVMGKFCQRLDLLKDI